MVEGDGSGPGDLPEGADADVGLIDLWQAPVFDLELRQVPVFLLPRLAEMATEVPDTDLGCRIYRRRADCLAVLARVARRTDVAAFRFSEPPSFPERHLGRLLSNAFYQECSLADIMLASGLTAGQVIAVGERTIRRRKWLSKLKALNPELAS